VQYPIHLAALIAAVFTNLGCSAQEQFQLRDADRVVFFGDSITDQRLYTTLVETYVLTRFPQLHVAFVHSGWGGDRVTGGAGGGINVRLARDVVAYNPTVVTIMLGMNDGRYRAFNDQVFSIFTNGYTDIVKRLKVDLPGVRITAIEPSPYDDVTRKPTFEGGYNAVLLQYSKFLRELGLKEALTVADLNTPVTAMLRRAESSNSALAQKILPDRVHPAIAGHLIMAEALLKAWHAPALVSSVEIDAGAHRVTRADNTAVSGLQFGKTIYWTQADRALPMPVDLTESEIALAIQSSDFMDAMNRETLKITGLSAGKHTLNIDGDEIGTFMTGELAAGVNLAAFKTPMYAQAARVHSLTTKHAAMHNTLWRNVQVPMEWEKPAGLQTAMQALDALDIELIKQQHAAALPVEHRFELAPGGSAFEPMFDGKDLTGLAHQPGEPSWQNGWLESRRWCVERHPGQARQRRHLTDRSQISELRSVARDQPRLRLRWRALSTVNREGRGLPGDDRLPGWWRGGWGLWRRSHGTANRETGIAPLLARRLETRMEPSARPDRGGRPTHPGLVERDQDRRLARLRESPARWRG
jgi:lysophospholipase L1-like esterase